MGSQSENFSGLVKEVRTQLNMSQEDLAHALGVSFATVNRWENEKTSPSKMAITVFKSFCKDQIQQKKLDLPGAEL